MKGLIRQDLIVLLSKNTVYMVVVLLFLLVVFAFSGMGMFSMVLPILIVGQLGVNTFHYESRSQWSKFTCTLPISRRKVVLARYATALSLICAGLIVSILYWLLLHVVFRSELTVAPAFMGLAFAILAVSINFPVFYHFGAERAGTFGTILTFAEYVLLGVLIGILPVALTPWIGIGMVVLSFICLTVSLYISVRIYQAKDVS